MNNSNKSLMYKIGTAEIIAFVIGVLLMMGIYKFFLSGEYFEGEVSKMIVSAAVVVFFASLFGPVTGLLIGYLGVMCSLSICNIPVDYIGAACYAILGLIVGLLADKFLIREGQTEIKQIIGWNFIHVAALIATFVFIMPFSYFIVHDGNLFEFTNLGIRIFMVCAFPIGIAYSIIFFLISRVFRYVKCRS